MTSLSFTVHGLAVGQGHKTARVSKNGKPFVVETSGQRHADWRARVAHTAQESMDGRPLFEGPVQVSLVFRMVKPKSAPKRRRTWPTGKRSGDLDTLARSCLDSMTGVVFGDDAQVVHLGVHKDYGDQPGVTVNVAGVEE